MNNFLQLHKDKIYQHDECLLRKKAKEFYGVKNHPELLIMRCLDIVTSDDGSIEEAIPGKGQLNATISGILFGLLNGQYTNKHCTTPIKTHYVSASQNNLTECLVKRMAQPIPLEVIVRNQAYGSFCCNYGTAEGTKFERPTCEFTLKDDTRNDPTIAEDHIWAAGIATDIEVSHMREVALAVNQILIGFFQEISIELIDFKLVFGREQDMIGDYTNLRIIGEISPDTCRLRDIKTGACLDKDIFRRGLTVDNLAKAYNAVSKKMTEYRKRQEESKYGVGAYDKNGNALK